MSRKRLSLPVKDNAQHHSSFYDRMTRARRAQIIERVERAQAAQPDDFDSPFRALMQSNRGVL